LRSASTRWSLNANPGAASIAESLAAPLAAVGMDATDRRDAASVGRWWIVVIVRQPLALLVLGARDPLGEALHALDAAGCDRPVGHRGVDASDRRHRRVVLGVGGAQPGVGHEVTADDPERAHARPGRADDLRAALVELGPRPPLGRLGDR
jgi:hypothetical protein